MESGLEVVNRKGQAAAELAILGVLIITAFSFIMNFGQSLGSLQQTKMESFRRALQKAYIRNGSVNFDLRKDIRAASVTSGFFQGQGLSPESSTSLTWQKGRGGDPLSINQGSFAFYQINDTEVKFNDNELGEEYGLPFQKQYTYNADGSKSDNEMLIPASILKNTSTRKEAYSFQGDKKESNTDINYNKRASLTDTTEGTIYTQFNTNIDQDPGDDDTPTPEYSDPEAATYTIEPTVYTYEQNWTVTHDLQK